MGLFMSPWTHHPSGWGIHSLTGKRETICEWRHRFFVSVNQTKQQRDQSFAWCLSVNALIHLNISQKKTTSIFVFIPRNQVWSAQTDRQTYICNYIYISHYIPIISQLVSSRRERSRQAGFVLIFFQKDGDWTIKNGDWTSRNGGKNAGRFLGIPSGKLT